jgi:hypothetical protein
MIQRSDADNFADVEHVRRITEYEDLLTRLAEARLRLPAQDQPAVFATESMLYRIVRGPLSLDEVRELRNTIDRLDLSGQMDAISGRWPAASSL